jgi:hypothetical protein
MSDQPSREDFSSIQAFIAAHEQFPDSRTPSTFQVLDRAVRFASNAIRTVDLQIRRIRETEPEDDKWLLRQWSDYQFLILALWNVRQSGKMGQMVDRSLADAIATFDRACPNLETMRNVLQHVDDYAIDGKKRRQKFLDGRLVGRRALEVGSRDESHFTWLGRTLDVSASREACMTLYLSIQEARDLAK